MKFAVVQIGGSQFKVVEGEVLDVEKLSGEKGDSIELDKVLMVADKNQVQIGQPLVKGVKVRVEIVDQFKGRKIRVATYKAKSRYRRTIGHRKLLTKIKIKNIDQVKTSKNKTAKKAS